MRKLNSESEILSKAIVGGAGMSLPPDLGQPPKGMGAIVLFVPLEVLSCKSPIEMQADMGLPWAGPGGEPSWFPDN